jgi:outer membrane protein, heavy metal efflux system
MTREAQAKVREAEAEKSLIGAGKSTISIAAEQFGDMVSVQLSWDLPLFPDSRQNPKIAAKHAELNQLEAEREALSREHTQQLEE